MSKMVEKVFVREYLESLKEDAELDYIFVFLLEAMGFKIVRTTKGSRGQSQYGKDIVAVKNDEKGITHKWFFELKGYDDRNIDQRTYMKPDGIRDSLIEAKDADFTYNGIPNFNQLPKKVILVHNGIIKTNIEVTFNGFIKQNFGEEEFERWDIYRLTDLFGQYLFGEYLLTDQDNIKLLKRTLIFLTEPEYEFNDLHILIQRVINRYKQKPNQRELVKLLATSNLLAVLIWHYSKEANNLHPAKYAIYLLVLQTWSFILSEKAQKKKKYLEAFNKLLDNQLRFLDEYFRKTLPIALTPKGLFTTIGFSFEPIGYRLRAFQYLDDLVYFFSMSNAFIHDLSELTTYENRQKEEIKLLVKNNFDALTCPIMDNQLIPIVHLFSFFSTCQEMSNHDGEFLIQYLVKCLDQICIRYKTKTILPLLGTEIEPLINLEINGERPSDYSDGSSLLINVLLELTAIFNLEWLYVQCREVFKDLVNLQVLYPLADLDELEISLFSKPLDQEYYAETSISLPVSFEDFKNKTRNKDRNPVVFKTNTAGYGFLKISAHSFYRSEPFPFEWRQLFDRVNVQIVNH